MGRQKCQQDSRGDGRRASYNNNCVRGNVTRSRVHHSMTPGHRSTIAPFNLITCPIAHWTRRDLFLTYQLHVPVLWSYACPTCPFPLPTTAPCSLLHLRCCLGISPVHPYTSTRFQIQSTPSETYTSTIGFLWSSPAACRAYHRCRQCPGP